MRNGPYGSPLAHLFSMHNVLHWTLESHAIHNSWSFLIQCHWGIGGVKWRLGQAGFLLPTFFIILEKVRNHIIIRFPPGLTVRARLMIEVAVLWHFHITWHYHRDVAQLCFHAGVTFATLLISVHKRFGLRTFASSLLQKRFLCTQMARFTLLLSVCVIGISSSEAAASFRYFISTGDFWNC